LVHDMKPPDLDNFFEIESVILADLASGGDAAWLAPFIDLRRDGSALDGALLTAAALTGLLDGAITPYRDAVILNAAAALIIAGRADDFREAARLAASSIDRGAARNALEKLRRASAIMQPMTAQPMTASHS